MADARAGEGGSAADGVGELSSFPRLLDRALPWALPGAPHGDGSLFWWTATPVALTSAVGGVLAIRASQVGSTDPIAGCGSLVLLGAYYPFALMVWVICVSVMAAGACQRLAGRPARAGEVFAWVLRPGVLLTLGAAAASVVVVGLATFFVLFLGGLVVLLLFAFLVPTMVDRDVRGLAALAASARLAWHNPSGRVLEWPMVRLLALVLLQFVMGAALQVLVSLPYQLFVQVVSLREIMSGQLPDPVATLGPWIWVQVPIQVLASLVQSWVLYYAAFVLGMLYRDLHSRTSGSDLEGAIERLFFPAAETGA